LIVLWNRGTAIGYIQDLARLDEVVRQAVGINDFVDRGSVALRNTE
jgi:hypothetical protein